MDDPVVVVGGGPVGMTAALLLARWRIPVLVLEADRGRQQIGSRSICQQRDVLEVWDAVGAGAIATEGLTWTTARIYWRRQELSSWQFADHGHSPFPPFVNLSQSRTEQILEALVAAHPLVELRRGHEVTSLSQDDTGVTLHCRNGATVRTPYVLACAGLRGGAVRDALGVRFEGESSGEQFLICDIRADLPDRVSERRFHFDPPWNPGRQVLIHPCPGSTFRIDWQVPPDFDLAAQRASGALERRIRDVIGQVPYELVWSSVYRFHSRVADRMRAGRVLLAGDCAHAFSPFGARGLNSGVMDAENAAWKLAFVRHGWAPERLLDSYHDERHAAAQENLAVTAATMRFLVPPDDAARRQREQALARAAADPSAAGAVDSGRLAEPYWYVDSPLTTGHPERVFTGRPPKGQPPPPVPGVLVPDAPVRLADRPRVRRLHELVRDGVLVLTTAGLAARSVGAVLGAATTAPTDVRALVDIDPTGDLHGLLDAGPGQAWVIRPDGHIAAVVDTPERAAAAVRRLLADP